jgi:uncharacterized membrane protein
MELVLVITFSGLIGGALRDMIPGRDRHGLGLMPSVAIMVASLAFVASVWLGLAPRSVWPWVISLGLATAAVVWLGVWLPRKRDADDERLFAELTETASS